MINQNTNQTDTFCATFFKSLGVPSRLEIFKFLQDKGDGGEATVSEIVNHVGLTQPTVSYHLGEMRQENILKFRKQGKEVYYSIDKICPHNQEECVFKTINFEQATRV